MENKHAYALSLLGLKPKSYTLTGWVNFREKHDIPKDILSFDDENTKLPESSKEFDLLAKSFAEEVSRPANMAVFVMDADDYVTMTPDKALKIFQAWIATCENMFFPAYVVTLSVLTKNFLKEHFRFKYADDGNAIVYRRVLDVEGTLWEECPDSKAPFSKLQGKLRRELEKTLVATGPAKEVNAYYSKDGHVEYMTNVAFYRIYENHRSDFASTVKGTSENIDRVMSRFDDMVATMKRRHKGDLTEAEILGGMQQLVETLAGMDESIDSYDFLYDQSFEPVELTNDPNVDAFAYFNLETLKEGPTPNFDGFLTAVVPACRDMLMAAVFATVFAPSLLNQYIWIHGEGGDGKSSFLNALMKFLGSRLCCSLGQTLNSEFGLENAVGKRMVILSDVKTGLSVKSQLIHNLTGHDPVSINRKNKPIITKELKPIVWIAANEAPDVNFDARNEARRCLYIKMQEADVEVQKKFYFLNEDGTFATDAEGRKINNGYDLTGELLKEMPSILYKCKQAFERVCPTPYSVIRPSIEAFSLAETNCLDIDANTWKTYLVETFEFTGSEDDRMLVTDIFEAVQETKDMHSDRSALNPFVKRDIKRLLTTAFGCQNKKIQGVRYLTGLKRKEA